MIITKSKLGEFAKIRQAKILQEIDKFHTIEYEKLKKKIDKMDMKILFKTFHIDSTLWDLVEMELIVSNYETTGIHSYTITEKGEYLARNIKI